MITDYSTFLDLEAEWNEKLRLHTGVVEDYERRAPEEAAALDAERWLSILDRHMLGDQREFVDGSRHETASDGGRPQP